MLRKGTFILMKTKIQDMTSGSVSYTHLLVFRPLPVLFTNAEQLYCVPVLI